MNFLSTKKKIKVRFWASFYAVLNCVSDIRILYFFFRNFEMLVAFLRHFVVFFFCLFLFILVLYYHL